MFLSYILSDKKKSSLYLRTNSPFSLERRLLALQQSCTYIQVRTGKIFLGRRPIDRATKSIRRLFLRAYKTSALCLAKQYHKAPAEFSCAAGHWRTAGWEPERPPATSAVIGTRLFSERSIRPRIEDTEFSSNGLKISLVDCNSFHLIALQKIIYDLLKLIFCNK